MAKRFVYYGNSFRRKIPDIKSLIDCVNNEDDFTYLMAGEVEDWIKQGAQVDINPLVPGCQFQFSDGSSIEYDTDGKITRHPKDKPPVWFIPEAEYWSYWLKNYAYKSKDITKLVTEIRGMELIQRVELCNLLFGLELKKAQPAAKTVVDNVRRGVGNTQGVSTKPKVSDMLSVEFFKQFLTRLNDAVQNNQIPTLQVLTGEENMKAVSANVKGSVRTYFQAITSDSIPNANRAASLKPEIYCDRLKPLVDAVYSAGVDEYYNELQRAIQEAGDTYIKDFKFTFAD